MGFKDILKRGIRYIVKGIPVYNTTVEVKTMQATNSLLGRNILITGGNRGLGFSFASKSISEGAKVVLVGRNEEKLIEAANKLGKNCFYLVYDIANLQDLDNLFLKAEKLVDGKVDSLISNAGISLHEGNFRNVTEETWDAQMNTNLKGNYFLVKKFVEYLESKEDKAGNIIVITSERAKRPDDIPYGLTKVATSSFVQCMARNLIEEDIRINGVAPGITASDMTGIDENGNMYLSFNASKRVFAPEEVAEVVHFLLSDFSSCINGEIINCDQGTWISTWPG